MANDFAIFLKFVSFFGVLWSCRAFFDIDELNSINYGIELIPKPVLLGEVGSGAHHILLSTKHGQQYQCTFQDKNIQAEKENKEEQSAKETGIPELLKPMEDGPCLLANKGWWTYEFCYGKQISQYHMDDSKIVGKTLILGVYHSEYNWDKDETAKKERLRRYHSQQYSNGSVCDLTTNPRRSEVRFVCDDSTGDFISTIDESESCVYIITVHTPRICHHPYLKPTRISKSVPIKCNPVLGQDDYGAYMNEVEAAEKKKEELAKAKAALRAAEEAEKKLVDELELDDILAQDVGSDAVKETDKVVDKLRDTLINVMKIRTETDAQRSERLEQLKRYRKLATKRLNKDGDVVEYEEGKGEETDVDTETELYAEFDKALSDIATDPKKRKILPKLKDHLKEAMTGEFDSILREAQEELKSEGQDSALDERVALKNLADTLSTLLEKLDESAKGVTEMEEKVKQSAKEAQAAREKLINKLMGDEEQKPKPTDEDVQKVEGETAPPADEDPTDPHPDSLTVRVTQRKEDENILKFDKNEGADLDADERKQLETQVKEELKRAGLDTRGQKIQVKIITSMSKGGDKLTEEDTTNFKRMVVAILGRNADEDAAAEKEETLMSAYNYRWRPQQPIEGEDEQK